MRKLSKGIIFLLIITITNSSSFAIAKDKRAFGHSTSKLEGDVSENVEGNLALQVNLNNYENFRKDSDSLVDIKYALGGTGVEFVIDPENPKQKTGLITNFEIRGNGAGNLSIRAKDFFKAHAEGTKLLLARGDSGGSHGSGNIFKQVDVSTHGFFNSADIFKIAASNLVEINSYPTDDTLTQVRATLLGEFILVSLMIKEENKIIRTDFFATCRDNENVALIKYAKNPFDFPMSKSDRNQLEQAGESRIACEDFKSLLISLEGKYLLFKDAGKEKAFTTYFKALTQIIYLINSDEELEAVRESGNRK